MVLLENSLHLRDLNAEIMLQIHCLKKLYCTRIFESKNLETSLGSYSYVYLPKKLKLDY